VKAIALINILYLLENGKKKTTRSPLFFFTYTFFFSSSFSSSINLIKKKMTNDIRYDGRVAIVTGAGGGKSC
jgi:hypothetical protein